MKRQTKRRRSAFWAAALGTFAAFAFSTASASAQVDSFDWKFDETGATLVGVKDKKITSAQIPATYAGKPVVAIGRGAFSWSRALKSVEFPASLKTVDETAFWVCESLEAVDLPEGLTTIKRSAFSACKALKTVELPASLQTLGEYAFSNCESLKSFSVASGSTAFRAVDGVLFSADGKTLVLYPPGRDDAEYRVPDGTERIADKAFWRCKALKNIDLAPSLTEIGANAFEECAALETVALPATLTAVGVGAFANCESLKSFSVAAGSTAFRAVDGVLFSADGKTLVSYPFGRKKIEYRVPNGTERIADQAFARCPALQTVVFPPGKTTVGEKAFYRCGALRTVAFPAGGATIERDAFGYCKALKRLAFEAGPTTVGVSAFEGCAALQRVEFADGLTKLDYRAFGNCDSLGIVALPASLTEIGRAAFEDLDEDGGQYDLKIVAPDGSFAAKFAERNGFRRAAPEK